MNVPTPTLIVFGNCQAQNIAEVFQRDPELTRRYRVQYLSSVAGAPPGDVTPESVAACRILFTQFDWTNPFPMGEHLGLQCRTFVFQSASLNFLYPFFSRKNPYNVPRPPALPWGPFPYGDDAIIKLIEANLPAAEILATYMNDWDAYGIDLDALVRLEAARIATYDESCDVKIADVLMANFHAQRLFFTMNHPTPYLYRHMLRRMIGACVSVDPALAAVDIEATFDAMLVTRPRGPLGSILAPIHPRVARHFALPWYDPNERFETQDGRLLSYQDYFAEMIAEFSRVRSARLAQANIVGAVR